MERLLSLWLMERVSTRLHNRASSATTAFESPKWPIQRARLLGWLRVRMPVLSSFKQERASHEPPPSAKIVVRLVQCTR